VLVVPNLTPHDYCDALRKGLGRALQDALRTGRLLDEQAVVDACVRNLAYDPQVECSRVDGLIEILDAAGAASRILEPILAGALERSTEVWDLAAAPPLPRNRPSVPDQPAIRR
jgi:hypothetical protein